MASPFAVFRRNQKTLLAVVSIAAILAFVFLDPLMRYMGRNSQVENPVVVETKYGAIKQGELDGMRQSRELVNLFLQHVSSATIGAEIKKGALDPRNAERAVDQWYGMWRQELMERTKPGSEESAVETFVLSKKAQQAGMIVTDRAINEFLKQVTNDSLTNADLQGVINAMQTGRGKVSAAKLFDCIRVEMLAAKFSQLFIQSLRDVPPAQRFEYYSRLNRKAKVTVLPLAVADFIAQVPDPSAEELQKFYDEHKDGYPDPTSPDPGFKQAKRAAFQYFKADFAKFKDQFKAQVTDAEISDYYDKNKTQFRAITLPGETPDAGAADATKADSDNKPAEDAKPDDSTKPDDTAKPDEEAKPDEAKPVDKPAAPEEQPAEKSPEATSPQSSDTRPGIAGEIAAARAYRNKIRFVQAKAGENVTKEASQAAEPVPAATEAEKPAADAAPAENAPAAEPPAENPADEKPAEQKPDASDAPAAETDQPAESGADKKAAAADEPKYEPLEKVADKIRESIAGEKASKHIGEIMDELQAEMRRYSDELDVYNTRKGTETTATAPKPFPFSELAKAKGVEAKESPPITAAEAAKEDIGQVSRVIQDRRSQFGFRFEPFADFAFTDSFLTYRPMTGQDSDGNIYLFWKTQEEAAYVPALDKIRDTVVRAWKMIKARDLARKRAEEYASQARAAQKTLAEFIGSQGALKVTETAFFSWLTIGNVPFDPSAAQPRISQVDGVENVGEQFMETVFHLSPAEISVAMNHPQDTAYAVQLVEYQPPLDELRQDFASEKQMQYMMVGRPEQQRMYAAWLDDLNKEAKVHWLRQAELRSRVSQRDMPQGPDDGEADF